MVICSVYIEYFGNVEKELFLFGYYMKRGVKKKVNI